MYLGISNYIYVTVIILTNYPSSFRLIMSYKKWSREKNLHTILSHSGTLNKINLDWMDSIFGPFLGHFMAISGPFLDHFWGIYTYGLWKNFPKFSKVGSRSRQPKRLWKFKMIRWLILYKQLKRFFFKLAVIIINILSSNAVRNLWQGAVSTDFFSQHQ